MKTPYSRGYFPPAPILTVRLAVPEEPPRLGPHQALVDTGADGTFVPTAFLEELGAPVVYTTNARPHLGVGRHRVWVYEVDVILDSLRFPGIEVVGDDWGSEIILGRNVLNRLLVLLDGPREMTDARA